MSLSNSDKDNLGKPAADALKRKVEKNATALGMTGVKAERVRVNGKWEVKITNPKGKPGDVEKLLGG